MRETAPFRDSAATSATPPPRTREEGAAYRLLSRAAVPFDAVFAPRSRGFGILLYHRVTPVEGERISPTMNVTPERFRSQLRGLLQRGYKPFALEDLIHRTARAEPIPASAFAVTFDDGFACIAEHAAPTLNEFDVPATVFVPTAFLDTSDPMPFDTWGQTPGAPVSAWRALASSECRDLMNRHTVTLGSHTHSHRDLRDQPEEFRRDLAESVQVLSEQFGLSQPAFSFPYGRVESGHASAQLAAIAKDLGVLCALTTENDCVTPGQSPFEWGRIHVAQSDTAATLAAKLSGWYATARGIARRLVGRPPREPRQRGGARG